MRASSRDDRAGRAELVIHGHNHVGSVAFLDGPTGRVPVIGAPSASAKAGRSSTRLGTTSTASDRTRPGSCSARSCAGCASDGTIGDLGMLSLGRPTV
jgi:hypothetical protein